MNNPGKISVVFSVYNESESLPSLFSEVLKLEKEFGRIFEWIFVDDGSADDSALIIRDFCRTYSHPVNKVRFIRFSRNFGHEAAMIAGIDHAAGDAVICMDADLQHPVSLIPGIVETFEKGYDIINMVRNKNEGTKGMQSWLSAAFYRFLNRISRQKIAENASDFFLVSKPVADILRENFRERNRFLRGLIQTLGFRNTTIGFTAPARVAGETKYSLVKLIALTSHAVVSFSKAPLFLGIWFGFFFSLISLVLGLYTIFVYLFGTEPPSGYTTIVLFLSLSFSILFFLIGIIGVYVGYLFDEQKKRPIYLIGELI
jgi:polyisoprenyl-phosphate glycosyltransferase